MLLHFNGVDQSRVGVGVDQTALSVSHFLSGNCARIVLETDVYCKRENFSSLSMGKKEKSRGNQVTLRMRHSDILSETKTGHAYSNFCNSDSYGSSGSMFLFC